MSCLLAIHLFLVPLLQTPGPPSAEIVPFDRTITEGGVVKTRLKAKRALVYKDRSLYLLDTVEQVIFHTGTTAFAGKANQGTWSTETGRITATGSVELHAKDLEHRDKNFDLFTESVEYVPKDASFYVSQPFRAISKAYTIEGDRAEGHDQGRLIYVEDRVHAVLLEPPEGTTFSLEGGPATLTAQSLEYHRDTGKGILRGYPLLTQGRSWLTAGRMDVQFDPDGNQQGTFSALSEVHGSLLQPGKPDPLVFRSERLYAHSASGILQMDENVVMTYQGGVLHADRVAVTLNRESRQVTGLVARGHVRSERGGERVEGETLTYHLAENRILMAGNPRLIRGASVLTARYIISDAEGKNIRVEGDVNGSYAPLPGEPMPDTSLLPGTGKPGSETPPVSYRATHIINRGNEIVLEGNASLSQFPASMEAPFIAFQMKELVPGRKVLDSVTAWPGVRLHQEGLAAEGEWMWFRQSEGIAILSGGCRAWQREHSLMADNMAVYPAERYLIADGNVVTNLILPQDAGSEGGEASLLAFNGGRLVVQSDHLEFDQNRHWAEFRGHVHASRGPGQGLSAERVLVTFSSAGNEVRSLVADGSVRVTFGERSGMGDTFIYHRDLEKGLLFGAPCIVSEPVQGSRGAVATFWFREDRYSVDGAPNALAQSLYLREGKYQTAAAKVPPRKAEPDRPEFPFTPKDAGKRTQDR